MLSKRKWELQYSFLTDQKLQQEKLSGIKNGITTHVSFSIMIFSGYICSSGIAGHVVVFFLVF